MGKPKKGGKKKELDWEDDVLTELESLKDGEPGKNENAPSEAKGKKPSGGRFQGLVNEDDDPGEDEGDEDPMNMATISQKSKKQKKKNKQSESVTVSTENNDITGGKSQDLKIGGDSDPGGDEGDDDLLSMAIISQKSKKQKKKNKQSESVTVSTENNDITGGKSQDLKIEGDSDPGGGEGDDDLLSMATISQKSKKQKKKNKQSETVAENEETKRTEDDDVGDDDSKQMDGSSFDSNNKGITDGEAEAPSGKKSKKKKKQDFDFDEDSEEDKKIKPAKKPDSIVENETDIVKASGMKTAAQKRAEKKEREKKKKEAEKAKAKAKAKEEEESKAKVIAEKKTTEIKVEPELVIGEESDVIPASKSSAALGNNQAEAKEDETKVEAIVENEKSQEKIEPELPIDKESEIIPASKPSDTLCNNQTKSIEAETKAEVIAENEKTEEKMEPESVVGKEGEIQGAVTDKPPTNEAEGEEPQDEEVDDEKEKKKKKKGEKKKKGPNKALVKEMQLRLQQMKQEEERLKQAEEEKQRALEEAENKRLEKLRLEQEKKELKKQKEKERIAKMKKEGTYLTKAQKQQRARAQAMLEAMQKQGTFHIPAFSQNAQDGEKRPHQYGNRKSKKQWQNQQKQQSQDTNTEQVPEAAIEEPIATTEEDKKSDGNEEDKQKEEQNGDNEEEEEADEVKDSWDVDSAEESEDSSNDKAAETTTQAAETTTQANVKVEVKEPVKTAIESKVELDESEESEEESESDEDDEESESDEESEEEERKTETVRERIEKRRATAEANRSADKLRSPVICVLGHVDTGKTKILDKIRHTHVQDGEAGGITQQIGATMVPVDAIREQTKMIKDFQDFEVKLPGLLIIDTPGHESFSNLRSRGSSLCDMAILVVDIMHGLEPQTLESINLLKKRKTPFVVALNKVDRLFEWKRGPNSGIVDTIKKQKKNTKQEFEERLQIVVKEFAEQSMNAAIFYNNPDPRSYVSLVPTSAHTGDGMGDLIAQVVRLTQTRLSQRLSFSEELQSMVLEVKALPGLGTTVDVILINGKLKEGDTIVVAGIEGPIVTQIRALLTPQPLKELRVKNQYISHKELPGAQGVKITAKDLEKALAGIPLFVAQQPDEVDFFKEEASNILNDTLQSIKLSDRGVYVQASTLGSLEALLEFLRTSKIPYSGVNIGPVHKKDIMKSSTMLEHDGQYAVVLAFDVRIERDAQEMADSLGVKIFSADIIYHLFDKFTAYREELKQKKRDEFKHIAVFPCKLRILPQHIFNSRSPIVVGVTVEAGVVKEGTPIAVPSQEFIDIGVVTGIEANHKPLTEARKGMEVCVKIDSPPGEAPKMFGRHFDHTDLLVSKISRESIDAVKEYFREDLQKSDWQLMIELKKLFEII
ncbi:eukaryotic translation initiation factor 5B-like isoform X2 [Acropora muricata]|uniref:eukaryotic translation initiation factor 5B-like isoform X2 n=1 Tax=Acropora muricata TaxID=159855 RepID=UPI0034E3B7DE